MSKAEKLIKDCERNCSNEIIVHTADGNSYTKSYEHWLTPDEARKAVEIAREEIYEWLKENMYMYNGECEGDRKVIINDLKQAMKDE